MSFGNETFQRIQEEIKLNLEREEERKQEYIKMLNGTSNNNDIPKVNGHNSFDEGQFNKNNNLQTSSLERKKKSIFVPNVVKTKGLMHQFFKSRGRMNTLPIKPNHSEPAWLDNQYLVPPRVTIENGKPTRNGYISAEEKIKQEVEEFQKREDELRVERRKSQPNLMALLDYEEELIANVHITNKPKLKASCSLADLCDTTDDELEGPGIVSLIEQFEKMKQ